MTTGILAILLLASLLHLPSVKLEIPKEIPPSCSAAPYEKGAYALIEIFNKLPDSWGFNRYGVRSIDVVAYERDNIHSKAMGEYLGDDEASGLPRIYIEATVYCAEPIADESYSHTQSQLESRVGLDLVCNSLIARAGETSFSCTNYQTHHGIVFSSRQRCCHACSEQQQCIDDETRPRNCQCHSCEGRSKLERMDH